MSTRFIASVVSILAVVLPLLGVEVGTEQLTVTAQTIVLVVSSLWVIFRGVQKGETTPLGVRK